MDGRMISIALFAFMSLSARGLEEVSEIALDLKLVERTFVTGERVAAVIDVKNMSQDVVTVDGTEYDDRLFVEVFRSSDMHELPRAAERPFVARFRVGKNEGQQLETVISDHFALPDGRYHVRPVLVHARTRYEGAYRVFEILPGVVVTRALQMFSNRSGLTRQFEVVRTQRRGAEHFFLKARDDADAGRGWQSTDLGPCLKFSTPTISILGTGEVVVIHRADRDNYVRSEFWSLPDALDFRGRETIRNPDTAGQENVQEMYKNAGGVKPVARPWWKFW